jgi:hypothetical protein
VLESLVFPCWNAPVIAPTSEGDLRPGSHALAREVARHFGRTVESVHTVAGGYSLAERLVVRWREGGSVFVKGAVDADTAAWLRTEHAIYARHRAAFFPALQGWQDDGAHPWLALEDLSEAFWPPPWSRAQIDAVLAALEEVAACPASDLPSMESRRGEFAGWSRVAAEPDLFLRLGVASARWLERVLPSLLAADDRAVLDGAALLHNDVRSDNLCFSGDRVVFVDWNWACRGNPKLDVAAWLPSLTLEGGPPPETLLPGEGDLAGFVAGFYAAHAGLPPLQGRPTLRDFQLAMLQESLGWATRALDLPAADGRRAGAASRTP